MKKMLTVTNNAYIATRTSVVLLVALTLGFGFWTATTRVATGQNMSPTEMIEANLPSGKTMSTASKPEFLKAVCGAVKKHPDAAPQIVGAAIEAKKAWARDVVSTAIRCLPGQTNCDAIAGIVSAAVAADPDDASGITEMVIRQYPDCRGAIGGGPGHGGGGGGNEGGNFTNPPPDVNPPPGSIGGGGGGFNPQEGTIPVCDNGVTVQIPASQVNAYLASHPGAFVGTCNVTQTTNN